MRGRLSLLAVVALCGGALLMNGCQEKKEAPAGGTTTTAPPPPPAPAPPAAPAPTAAAPTADAGTALAGDAGTTAGAAPSKAGATAAITPEARAEAKEIFTNRCVACHGANGAGDGPTAAVLNPKPRNYHDQAWQKSVTDEQIEKTIVQGGAAVGKSPLMPPNPDLANKPAVVAALREIVRSFAGK